MKKILVVTPYFYPDKGGVANHTYNLYKRLAESSEYDITVLASAKKESNEILDDLKVIRFPYWFKISNSPFNGLWLFQIPRLISKIKPDVVIVHTPVPIMPDIAVLLSMGTPVIIKYHHGGSMAKGKLLVDLLIKIYEATVFKLVFRKAKIIISASSFVADNYLKRYKKKMIVITPGVDLDKFSPSKSKSQNKILFVANLNKSERYKGLEYLIEAMPQIKKLVPRARLGIVGGGDDLKFYQKLTRSLSLNDSVTFYGKLGDERLKLYRDCSILVLPSLFESCPNVILEAMASKKPVAAAKTTGIPYLVENGKDGILFAPKDSESLAEAVIKILKDKKLASRLANNGLRKVRSFYSWNRKVEETVKVINSLN